MRAKDAFVGYWRITGMEVWDNDYLDLVVLAHITFDPEGSEDIEGGGSGRFQFGAVDGWPDCRFSEGDGAPFVEFSWYGSDDSDDACGRGLPSVTRVGSMTGHPFTHDGDDSPFTAFKRVPPRSQ